MSPSDFFRQLVRRTKPTLRACKHGYVRWRYKFNASQLSNTLEKLDVRRGDPILVHSSMEGFGGWAGSVPEILNVFEEAVGERGTLMMPTLSMSGSAIDLAESGAIFDTHTTPSRSGLLPEVFRRMKGVVRSMHPTHSVAVWGADKDWWIENHYLADSPCGRGTPFYRLWERNGKIVLAGVDISTITFFHCAEEILEPLMPFSPFTSDRYVMRCRLRGQLIQTAPMRLYAHDISRRRCLRPLEIELRRKGLWREGRVGSLGIIVLTAAEVLRTLEEMAGHGQFCYN